MIVGNRLWRFSGSLYTRAEGLYIRSLTIKLILIMKLYQFMYFNLHVSYQNIDMLWFSDQI